MGQGRGDQSQDQSHGRGAPRRDDVVIGARPTDGGAAGQASQGQGEQEGIGSLLAGIVKDLQDLVRGEIQLAKTELKEDATAAGKGVALLVAGAFLGLVAFIFLMLAVTYLLDKVVQLWLAAGIVGLALLAVAAMLALSGKRQVSAGNFKPEQTIETLKEDREWAKQQISSVKK